jgi:hypothetical protein
MYFYHKLLEATGYQVLLQLENGVCCEAEYINILMGSVKSSSRITSAMFRQRNKTRVIGKAPNLSVFAASLALSLVLYAWISLPLMQ